MKNTLQTKRNKPSGPNFRKLLAKTTRKRRLNAATAAASHHSELESDVPNVGIGRALLVILILHILAIAAIFVHNNYFEPDAVTEVESNKSTPVPATTPAPAIAAIENNQAQSEDELPEENMPLRGLDSERYIVATGDTYKRISDACRVDERSLRALNSNRPLRAGIVLDLPGVHSSRPVAIFVKPMPMQEAPATAITPIDARTITPVAEAPASRAILVKPTINRFDMGDSGKRYTVKTGDTVWRIANRYKVSRENLLKINNITDPTKLYIGKKIKIPTK